MVYDMVRYGIMIGKKKKYDNQLSHCFYTEDLPITSDTVLIAVVQ